LTVESQREAPPMTRRGKKYLLKPLVLVIAGLSLAGCISPQADSVTGRYTAPIGGSPVISNETPYSAALRCMAGYTSQRPLRIAVGQMELKYANNKLIGSDQAGGPNGGPDYRQIIAGSIPGSDYYLVGGITE